MIPLMNDLKSMSDDTIHPDLCEAIDSIEVDGVDVLNMNINQLMLAVYRLEKAREEAVVYAQDLYRKDAIRKQEISHLKSKLNNIGEESLHCKINSISDHLVKIHMDVTTTKTIVENQ